LKIYSFIILLLTIVINGCVNSGSQISKEAIAKVDSFCNPAEIKTETPVPENTKGVNYILKSIKSFEKLLPIKKFNTKEDSIIIRVWLDIGIAKNAVFETGITGQLFWGNLYEYIGTSGGGIRSFTKVNYTSQKQLQYLFSTLIEKNILSFKNINDWGAGGGDGTSCCVEVYSKNNYLFYEYWCPFSIKDENKVIENFISILLFLKRTLSLTFGEC
jgi:hypothetical protein